MGIYASGGSPEGWPTLIFFEGHCMWKKGGQVVDKIVKIDKNVDSLDFHLLEAMLPESEIWGDSVFAVVEEDNPRRGELY